MSWIVVVWLQISSLCLHSSYSWASLMALSSSCPILTNSPLCWHSIKPLRRSSRHQYNPFCHPSYAYPISSQRSPIKGHMPVIGAREKIEGQSYQRDHEMRKKKPKSNEGGCLNCSGYNSASSLGILSPSYSSLPSCSTPLRLCLSS